MFLIWAFKHKVSILKHLFGSCWVCLIFLPVSRTPPHSKSSHFSDNCVLYLIIGTHVSTVRELFLVWFDYSSMINKVAMTTFARFLGWPSYGKIEFVRLVIQPSKTKNNTLSQPQYEQFLNGNITLHFNIRRYLFSIMTVYLKKLFAYVKFYRNIPVVNTWYSDHADCKYACICRVSMIFFFVKDR